MCFKKNLKYHSFLLSIKLFLLLGCSSESEELNPALSSKESVTLKREANEGRHIFKDGSIYEGQLVMGQPNGFGSHEFLDGNIYEGQHKNGLAHGHGTMRYKSVDNLDQYVGHWKSGKRDGFGTLILEDGTRLVGNWKDDNFHVGEYIANSGVIMSGLWDNEYLSEGYMKTEDGREYSGTFKDQGMFDQGSIKLIGGEHYSGQFENNEYHGQGILTGNDNILYTGSFKNGKFSGYGILRESDGSVYSGEFLEGIPHGEGVQSDYSGVVYSGKWVDGEKNGLGTLDFGDGTSYTGEFKNGFALKGLYDWGDGVFTDSYQDENGNWLDRED